MRNIFLLMMMGLMAVQPVQAEDFTVSFYGGWAMDDKFSQMPWPGNWQTYDEGGHLAGAGVAYEALRFNNGRAALEVEGQVMRHWGYNNLWEGVLAGWLRWHDMPWDAYIESSAAFGAGFSHFSKISPIEQRRLTDQARTLGYLGIELTAAPPQREDWQGVLRIHHRSGAFGLINDVKGGSNYLVLGLRKIY